MAKISLVLLSIFKRLKVFDLLYVELLMFRRDAFFIKTSNWDCAVCLFFSKEANKMEILLVHFA